MRRLVMLAVAVATIPLAPAPARAADVTTIGCIADEMGLAGRALLAKDMEINLQNSGKEQKYRPETVESLRGAADRCAKHHGWNDKARMASTLYNISRSGWPIAQKMAPAANLSVPALTRHFQALSEADRRKGASTEVLTKLATSAVEAGDIVSGNAALAGAMFGLMGMEYSSRADFVDS